MTMQLSLIRAGCSVLAHHAGCIWNVCSVFTPGCRAISTDQHVSSSQLIAKWQGLLQSPQQQTTGLQDQHSSAANHLPTEQLRQLCQDAIHVYSTEGAASVVPDRVSDIFMAAYSQLQGTDHKLAFFKLLVTEFGVQRQAVDAAVQLWLQRAAADNPPTQNRTRQQQQHSVPTSVGTTTSNAQASLHSGSSSSDRSNSNGSSSSSSSGAKQASASSALMYRLAERLSSAAQPLYLQLLLPVSQHKSGISFLVQLRGDLLRLLRDTPAAELGQEGVGLRALDQHLRSALARWFSLGLLQLQRITWESSPGQLLQRVQATEAVHRMQHLEQLQRRLQQSDRRVYAFMHPSLPGEPLVVLHTALLQHIPRSMDQVLGRQQDRGGRDPSSSSGGSGGDGSSKGSSDGSSGGSHGADRSNITGESSTHTTTGSSDATGPDLPITTSGNTTGSSSDASVACFYSVSSSQKGLSGVDLGTFLIKKAAQLLLAELPGLQTLVTLSPIPGYRTWLITRLQQAAAAADSSGLVCDGEAAAAAAPLLRVQDVAVVLAVAAHSSSSTLTGPHSNSSQKQSPLPEAAAAAETGTVAAAAGALLQLVQDNSWVHLPTQQQEALGPVLLRLCALYLLTERRRNFALDPVAHFHLRNGAQLWRINWRADLSPSGLSGSCGLMVNYMYDLNSVTTNNQQYLLEHDINAAPAVQELLL